MINAALSRPRNRVPTGDAGTSLMELIIGMALITAAIGLPVSLTAARLGGLNHALLVGAGLLSLGFGLFLAYQIGIVDGLFISGPPT